MKKERMKNFTLFLLPAGLILGIIMGELTEHLALGIGIGALLGGVLSLLVRKELKEESHKKYDK